MVAQYAVVDFRIAMTPKAQCDFFADLFWPKRQLSKPPTELCGGLDNCLFARSIQFYHKIGCFCVRFVSLGRKAVVERPVFHELLEKTVAERPIFVQLLKKTVVQTSTEFRWGFGQLSFRPKEICGKITLRFCLIAILKLPTADWAIVISNI